MISMDRRLSYSFSGDDYAQTLDLFYASRRVFNGIADDLVSSASGELQVCLTFSGSVSYPHILKVADNFVVLCPQLSCMKVTDYLRAVNGLCLVWPISEIEELWTSLRYNTEEVLQLSTASSRDLFRVWLISSGAVSTEVQCCSSLAQHLINSIAAEEPEGYPSVSDIIDGIDQGSLSLDHVIEAKPSSNQLVSVFLSDKQDDAVVEWKAVSVSRDKCLVGEDIFFAIKQNSLHDSL